MAVLRLRLRKTRVRKAGRNESKAIVSTGDEIAVGGGASGIRLRKVGTLMYVR